jgi:hypothetical protein
MGVGLREMPDDFIGFGLDLLDGADGFEEMGDGVSCDETDGW